MAAEQVEVEPVYYHNCPALGKETKVITAYMADAAGEYILYTQNKCPFCSYAVQGTKKYAKGVKPDTLGGYYIDTTVAEKMS